MSDAGVTLDTSGNVLVSDVLNNRLRRVTPAGLVSTFASLSVNRFFVVILGDRSVSASFILCVSVAYDASGNLFGVSDDNMFSISSTGDSVNISGSAGGGFADGQGYVRVFLLSSTE